MAQLPTAADPAVQWSGNIEVNEPLIWPAVYGGKLTGRGSILADSTHKANLGCRVIHTGLKKSATLRYRGFGGCIDDLTFSGDRRLNKCPADERTSVGLVVDKQEDPPSGFGTGKLLLPNVSFTQYDKAIQLGWLEPGQSSASEHNADQLTIGRIHTHDCGTMLRVEHEQGVDVRIYGVARPYKTSTVFDFEGGGNLHCSQLYCMYGVDTILRTGQAVGSNNASYVFDGIICDTNNDVPVFVRQEKRSAAMEITFRHVRIGNKAKWPDEPAFQLKGGASLTLDHFKELKPQQILYENTLDAYANHVHLENAIASFGIDRLFHPDSKGECFVTVGAAKNLIGKRTFTPGSYCFKNGMFFDVVTAPAMEAWLWSMFNDAAKGWDKRLDAIEKTALAKDAYIKSLHQAISTLNTAE